MKLYFNPASPFVRMVRDDTADTWFDPVGSVPELADSNPLGYSEAEMSHVVDAFLAERLVPALEASRAKRRLVYEYGRLGIVYQLDVVFPSGPRSWQIAFATVALTTGPSPRAQIRARIAASLLVDLVRGETSSSYVYSVGGYRFVSRIYAAAPEGLHAWKPASHPDVADPLWLAFDLEDLFRRSIDRDIVAHGGVAQPAV